MTLSECYDALNGGHCHIENKIVSLSLSNLPLPNSNLFPLASSNLAEGNGLKINFRTPKKDRRNNTLTRYVFPVFNFAYETPLGLEDLLIVMFRGLDDTGLGGVGGGQY